METMSGPSSYSVDSQADADLLSMPFDQFLYGYVDVIFSDYLDRTATLPEVLDEIKTIIAILVEALPAKDKLPFQAGGYRPSQMTGELGRRR